MNKILKTVRKRESSSSVNNPAAAAAAAPYEPVYLEHKLQKKWVDEKSKHVCYEIFARALYITWGESGYWDWTCFKETGKDGVEVAKLKSVCWFDVRGKFKISLLSPGVEYEIFYVVKLQRGSASGWELPVTLSLSIPKKMDKARKLSLLDEPHGEWIELSVGWFMADENETEEIYFDLYEHGGHWKNGILVRGAIIRPRLS